MKKLFGSFVLLAALIAGPAFAGVEIGKTAPDYSFKDINGEEHSISDLDGKIVVLEWTNPNCPFVHKFYDQGDMPRIQAEAKKMSKDVYWIAINSSAKDKEGYFATDEEAKADVAARKYAGDIYVRDPEGKFGKLYGAKTTPHMFVIDEDNKVAYAGAIDSIKSPDQPDIAKADNYVLAAVKALVAGKQPKVGSTESYGCGVKYNDPLAEQAPAPTPVATPAPAEAAPAAAAEKAPEVKKEEAPVAKTEAVKETAKKKEAAAPAKKEKSKE